jgi:hypothetical protein
MSVLSVLLLMIMVLSHWLTKTIEPFEQTRYAIVVLTRGYDTLDKYKLLVERNNAIYDVFYSKLKEDLPKYDILIYHEGNITTEQQSYIQSKTPGLPMLFKTIHLIENQENHDFCPPTVLSNSFSNGYKNMCHFWSIDFLHYLKDYTF